MRNIAIFICFFNLITSCNNNDGDLVRKSVTMSLDKTYFDINHVSYDLINIPEGQGVILFKDINKKFGSKKSVRLGGYFYGGWENGDRMSKYQIDWIKDNLYLLALNMFYKMDGVLNGGMTQVEIQNLIKSKEDFSFYCMLFATTLIPPYYSEETMKDWTVKSKSGKEALGVRRQSDDDIDHLMDLGNTDYANWFREFTIAHSEKYNAKGVIVDELMWGGYLNLSIDDMADYNSVQEITDACYSWLSIVNRENPVNILTQAHWNKALQYQDGIWGEKAYRSDFKLTENNGYGRKVDWHEIVKKTDQLGKINMDYLWAAWYERDNQNEFLYCLSAYLIGKSSESIYLQLHPIYDGGYPNNLAGYDISNYIEEVEKNRKYLDIYIGDPQEDIETIEIDGSILFKREFENGLVICFPYSN